MLLTSLLSLATVFSPPAIQDATWTVGSPLPHIHLPEITTGKPIDLAQYRGKKILIAEFASW